jgi:CRP-like cAMP-binding protein
LFTIAVRARTQGDIGDAFYIIKAGEAEVIKLMADGTKKTVDYKYQGDYFGDEALTKGLPRNATIVAAKSGQKRTEALRVDKSTFMQLLGPIHDVRRCC